MQTDTPVMSEDDNTNGADDSAFSSNILINQQSLTEELNIAVPTSTSYADMCHNTTNVSDNSDMSSPLNTTATDTQTEPSNKDYDSDIINSSSSAHHHQVNSSIASTEGNKSTDYSFETAVTSTNMMLGDDREDSNAEGSSTGQSVPNVGSVSPQFEDEPTDLTINSSVAYQPAIVEKPLAVAEPRSTAPDISGLELLSNSIVALEEERFIKQEPVEKVALISPSSYNTSYCRSNSSDETNLTNSQICTQLHVSPKQSRCDYAEQNEQLGGLNLLCALAEQRIQEEVGQRTDRKRSSSSDGSEPKRSKKHKDKHSSKKSKKKDRKEKKRHSSSDIGSVDTVERNLKESYNRVAEKYANCNCSKTDGINNNSLNCHCQKPWLTAEELYNAMESDMRIRLAKLAKEEQEQKRKLESMTNKVARLQRESTPSSSKSSTTSSKQSVPVPTFSPSILSSSSLDCNQNSSGIDFMANGKSDTESCSSTSSKRKNTATDGGKQDGEQPAKKSKGLVNYIFSSKKRLADAKFEGSFSASDETSANSDISATLKRAASIKHETYEFEDTGPQATIIPFSKFNEANALSASRHKQETFGTCQKFSKHAMKIKHHKKTKEGKEQNHHHCAGGLSERKQRINDKCRLTRHHLENLVSGQKLRVLKDGHGLFYAGYLSAVEPPDVYAITLDGERGNKPYIMSREEILRDAVSF